MSSVNPLPNISLAMPQVLAPATRPAAGGISGPKPGANPAIDTPAAERAPERAALGSPTSARRTVPIGTQPPPRALSAEAPAGVDPELWSVLTTEERTHFAKLAAMGPLTYGRGLSAFGVQDAPPPAVRGARLDIRV